MLALTRGHRDTRDRPHVLHPAPVVIPAARLLEPAQVDVLDSLTELNRLSGRIALVGITHEHEVRTGVVAHDPQAPLILRRRFGADLELHPGEALAQKELADPNRGQRIPIPAPQLVEREPHALPKGIPHGAVDAGDGLHGEPAVAQPVVRG